MRIEIESEILVPRLHKAYKASNQPEVRGILAAVNGYIDGQIDEKKKEIIDMAQIFREEPK